MSLARALRYFLCDLISLSLSLFFFLFLFWGSFHVGFMWRRGSNVDIDLLALVSCFYFIRTQSLYSFSLSLLFLLRL